MKTPTDFYKAPPKQGPVGKRPRSYFSDLPGGAAAYSESIEKILGKGETILRRDQVRDAARDMTVNPLVAYACIMAWGGRNFRNYRLSLRNGDSSKVTTLVEFLRRSTASRRTDFEYTKRAALAIPGLGISFYTKLLFFLREEPDAYILDQWTAKSAAVLFPKLGIRLTSAGLPDPKTSAKAYEGFCAEIEHCVGGSGWGTAWTNGEEVERTIFDRPGGLWRSWLNGNFESSDGKMTPRAQSAARRAKPPKPPKAPPPMPPVPPPPNPNAGGGLPEGEDRVRAFAGFLRVVYLERLDDGDNLPQVIGRFAPPNRLHVMGQDGLSWQFIINQGGVYAQLFFPPAHVGTYDGVLVPALFPQVNDQNQHQFGEGILGNGPNMGATRAISCYPDEPAGGYLAPADEWFAICTSAVDAMQQLFEFFEPHLP